MANRKPLVENAGQHEQLQSGDNLDLNTSATGVVVATAGVASIQADATSYLPGAYLQWSAWAFGAM